MSSDVKDMSVVFEAVKTSLSQNKTGVILRLAIHPDDVPRELMTAWVGSRYQVVMVQIGDDEQPTASDETIKANKAVSSAAMLCREHTFQEWLMAQGYTVDPERHPAIDTEEDWAAAALRQYLGINSRAELRTNEDALKKFYELRQSYMDSFDGT